MRSLVQRFITYPIYANIIIGIVLIGGIVSMLSMNKSFFPERESRIIAISVYYPGASPIEMEEGVTSRLEEAVRGLVGIKEITSESSENRARITLETTGEYNINEVLMEVKNAVDGVSSLPSAAERPIVAKRRARAIALRMAVVPDDSSDIDLMALKVHAQRIEEDFYASGVMSQISVSGYPQPEISVEIKEDQLLRYNVTFNEIISAIQNNNRDVSGGQIKSDEEELLIRLRSRSTNTGKIGNIIIRGNEDGSFIRIHDVAEVKKKFADTPNKSWLNGKIAISINVDKLPEEDLDEITNFAEKYAENFNSKNQGAKLVITRAYLDILKSRLKLLQKNGMLGLILVILSLSFFLSTRVSLWVAVGIPFSFLAMFIFGNLIGLTMNMISLFGMILVVGILVDDGIVIAENIYVHFENGKTPVKAALDGTMEVLPAVLTSVTTTIVAFSPLLFMAGTRMEMMIHVAIVVIVSLFFSLFEAFFILPAHLGSHWVLSKRSLEAKKRNIRKYFDGFFIWLRDSIYHYTLRWIIKWRYIVVFIPLALFIITAGLYLGGRIKNTFFPRVDFNRFEINVAFTPGSGEKQTIEFIHRCENAIWKVNEDLKKRFNVKVDMIERVNASLGRAFENESGAHACEIRVYPRDLEGFDISGFEIANRVKEKIGPVPEALRYTVGGSNRWGAPVSIGLMSKNIHELEEAKSYLMTKLDEFPQLKDIIENVALGKEEIRLHLKQKAYFLGLNENDIARQVRQGFYGGQAQRLQEGRDELRIWVRYPKTDREMIGQMENMKIKTPQGYYPLSELIDYDMQRSPVTINRFNGSREIRVEAELVDPLASVPEILEQIEEKIMPDLLSKFTGVRYAFHGQQKYSREATGQMGHYFLIAFALILILIVIHFKSLTQPLIVIFMIPLSVLGVFWGHGIHGEPLSIMSLWGIVALTGVIINDAIIFLAKYNGLLLEGYQVKEAIIRAGKSRLRPIILTTVTTSVGLFPMLLETSIQAQFLIPMAISLAYGVAVGTVFILIFFPVLILILNDIKLVLWRGIKHSKLTREDIETIIRHNKRKHEFDKNNEIH